MSHQTISMYTSKSRWPWSSSDVMRRLITLFGTVSNISMTDLMTAYNTDQRKPVQSLIIHKNKNNARSFNIKSIFIGEIP
jgi:hypothetical protein